MSSLLTFLQPFLPHLKPKYYQSNHTKICCTYNDPLRWKASNNNGNDFIKPSRELLENLRQKLSEAVIRQDFSEAAILRDRISEAEKEAPDDLAITLANDAFYIALRRADIDGMCEIWMGSDTVSCAFPLGGLLVGFDAVIDGWRRIFVTGAPTEVNVENVQVELRRNIAWVICTQNIAAIRGNVAIGGQRVATNIFQKRRGKWHIVHHHASPVILTEQQGQKNDEEEKQM